MADFKTLTVILAGGKGERLIPLTQDRAKPAVPFGGNYRIIDFTLSNCINSDLRKILLFTQYKASSLNRHIRLGWNFLPATLGEYVEIVPPQQRINENWYQGTADAIRQNIYNIEREDADLIMILAGDHIYKMDYRAMLQYHWEKGALVTVGVKKENFGIAKQMGCVIVNDENQVEQFVEKPENPSLIFPGKNEALISLGIYVFDKQYLMSLLRDYPEDFDFGKNIMPRIVKDGRTYGFDLKYADKSGVNYWKDIGTIEAFYEANMDLISPTPRFNLYDASWPTYTYHYNLPAAKVIYGYTGRKGEVEDSILGYGAIVSGGDVRRSVISPQVTIEDEAVVEDSILLNKVNVNRGAKIRRAIIDKEVVIEHGAIIGYDLAKDKQRFYVSENGIVVVPKGTVVKK
jgi:glucose-1-phosphate adenylyltransferase